MSDEDVKQRIAYLVEHGGLYTQERPRWLPWAAALVVLELVSIGVSVMQ